MRILFVGRADVPRLLPMRDCVRAMDDVLRSLARGEAILPLRQVLMLPAGNGAFAAMPAVLPGIASVGLKAITVVPGNHGTELDSHQGAVLLFETEQGRLQAVLDASSITAIRTAAVSAVATRALARAGAGDLAMLGSGVQALTHLEAMASVTTLRRVRAWSRHAGNVAAFAARAGEALGIEVEPASTAREAVKGADIVCTVTASETPVLEGAWVSPGTHVNAVGASLKRARELDTALVRAAGLFVDRRESALNEAGDFLIPRAEGAIGDDHIRAELGEVLVGSHPGRQAEDEVTVFKSLGLAIEDVAAARLIYQKAQAENAGTWLDLTGAPQH